MSASTMSKEAKSSLTDTYKKAADTASATVDSLKENAKHEYDIKKAEAEMLAAKASSMVIERPLVSIGCAFAAGWLISKILK